MPSDTSAAGEQRAEWVRRVLKIEVSARATEVPDEGAEGIGAFDEGPSEQGRLRADDYRALLDRINEELDYPRSLQEVEYLDNDQSSLKGKYAGWANRLQQLQSAQNVVDQLAQAADFVALKGHIDTAQTLLKEIVVACRSGGITRPDGLRSVEHRKATAEKLLSFAAAANENDKNQISDQLSGKNQDDAWDVETLVGQAAELVDADKLREKLGEKLATLGTCAKKYAPVNPVSLAVEQLMDRTTEGDMLDGAAAAELWASALVEVEPLLSKARATLEVRTGIMDAAHIAEVSVLQTPKEFKGRDEQLESLKKLKDDTRGASSKAATIDILNVEWKKLLTEAVELRKTISEWRASFVDTAAVKADLKELNELVNNKTFWNMIEKSQQKPMREVILRSRTAPNDVDTMNAAELRGFAAQIAQDLRDASAAMVSGHDSDQLNDMLKQRRGKESEAESVGSEAFWQAALEKKFGVKINIPEGIRAKKLPQLYDFFQRLPDSQVVKDMIKDFDYETVSGPARFVKRSSKIVMTNMSREIPEELQDQLKYPVPGSDDKELVDYFSIVTLHEIGHAVDAKNTFMTQNEGTSTLGDWKSVKLNDVVQIVATDTAAGLNPQPPAEDVAKLVRRFLLTGKLDRPPSAEAPLGALLNVWDALTQKLNGYKDISIKAGKPWEKPVPMSDKRNYHEGYAGIWVSYATSERDNSVSQYQWRAPGEWFAELYAWHFIEPDPDKRKQRTAKLPKQLAELIAS